MASDGDQEARGDEGAMGDNVQQVERVQEAVNTWGFPLSELYHLALTFYKEKEGKAFHLTYDSRLSLMALSKQASAGPYQPETGSDVGYLDVLGSDRRREWAALGEMGKQEAVLKFVEKLAEVCTTFGPYIASHRIERDERERRRREEAERMRREAEEAERRQREEDERKRIEEQQNKLQEEERMRQEQQKQQIMLALNAQTATQFQQYAAQQFPGNPGQQQLLIRQLQEQHYLQYIQQLYQMQIAQQAAALKQQEGEPTEPGSDAQTQDDTSADRSTVSAGEDVLDNGHEESRPCLAAPSMWTRPQIRDFKEKVRQDAESVITVGRGEVVTVRVPTHDEGSYLFWEFATDHYDVGFGVCFEWSEGQAGPPNVHLSESSEEEEDEVEAEPPDEVERNGDVTTDGGAGAVGGGGGGEQSAKALVQEVVPVYRRDCHVEVYAGSHQYPGRGVYLLKFDNSYSLWRSKTVYYRVYYTR
uniref:Golgi resident protein GCP60 n=1 Tax=Eptatretus burgeri TaxID=7764 RepID=A0A8C4QHD8_EPTBU